MRMASFVFPHLLPHFMWEHARTQGTALDAQCWIEAVFTMSIRQPWSCQEERKADTLSAILRQALASLAASAGQAASGERSRRMSRRSCAHSARLAKADRHLIEIRTRARIRQSLASLAASAGQAAPASSRTRRTNGTYASPKPPPTNESNPASPRSLRTSESTRVSSRRSPRCLNVPLFTTGPLYGTEGDQCGSHWRRRRNVSAICSSDRRAVA